MSRADGSAVFSPEGVPLVWPEGGMVRDIIKLPAQVRKHTASTVGLYIEQSYGASRGCASVHS